VIEEHAHTSNAREIERATPRCPSDTLQWNRNVVGSRLDPETAIVPIGIAVVVMPVMNTNRDVDGLREFRPDLELESLMTAPIGKRFPDRQ
jgi:hypothetical protein